MDKRRSLLAIPSTDGLGIAVDEQSERMPNSSRSPRGRATEALRVETTFLAREGCGPTD